MARPGDRHFFADFGALCGALPPYEWSMNEAQTTCGECRKLLEGGSTVRPPAFLRSYQEVVTRRARGHRR